MHDRFDLISHGSAATSHVCGQSKKGPRSDAGAQGRRKSTRTVLKDTNAAVKPYIFCAHHYLAMTKIMLKCLWLWRLPRVLSLQKDMDTSWSAFPLMSPKSQFDYYLVQCIVFECSKYPASICNKKGWNTLDKMSVLKQVLEQVLEKAHAQADAYEDAQAGAYEDARAGAYYKDAWASA